ncbi:hypothetical protein [Candidatus Methylacidithermus pantelleriae]|nr:hypothetical protein [Candidatus Methylacidithermus pantelleriae]
MVVLVVGTAKAFWLTGRVGFLLVATAIAMGGVVTRGPRLAERAWSGTSRGEDPVMGGLQLPGRATYDFLFWVWQSQDGIEHR